MSAELEKAKMSLRSLRTAQIGGTTFVLEGEHERYLAGLDIHLFISEHLTVGMDLTNAGTDDRRNGGEPSQCRPDQFAPGHDS